MGSSGQKRRKGNQKPPQHLAKVGTKADVERHQHAEREAVAANMGLGSSPSWLKGGLMVVVVLLVIGAIVGLLLLTVFK